MDDVTHRISTEGNDVLLYETGADACRFPLAWAMQPRRVVVPSTTDWRYVVPMWAWDRRREIVPRILQAGYVVEIDDAGGTVQSSVTTADRAYLIEERVEPDDRGPGFARVRIIATDRYEVLADLTNASLAESVEFPAPGRVELLLRPDDPLQPMRIGINLAAREYWLNPHDQPEPLDQLGNVLAAMRPARAPTYVHPGRSGPRAWLSAIFFTCLGVVATGCSLLVALVLSKSTKDYLIGWFGTVFFGVCLWAAISDLRAVWRRTRPTRGFAPALVARPPSPVRPRRRSLEIDPTPDPGAGLADEYTLSPDFRADVLMYKEDGRSVQINFGFAGKYAYELSADSVDRWDGPSGERAITPRERAEIIRRIVVRIEAQEKRRVEVV